MPSANKRRSSITCFDCDSAKFETRYKDKEGTRNGETVKVHLELLVCPRCGYKTIPPERVDKYVRLVSDTYRANHGLLTGSEIKELRNDLGMTQRQFATYLGGVGVASVKRWESGQIQDKSMDELMRVKCDLFAAKRNLSAGVI